MTTIFGPEIFMHLLHMELERGAIPKHFVTAFVTLEHILGVMNVSQMLVKIMLSFSGVVTADVLFLYVGTGIRPFLRVPVGHVLVHRRGRRAGHGA